MCGFDTASVRVEALRRSTGLMGPLQARCLCRRIPPLAHKAWLAETRRGKRFENEEAYRAEGNATEAGTLVIDMNKVFK